MTWPGGSFSPGASRTSDPAWTGADPLQVLRRPQTHRDPSHQRARICRIGRVRSRAIQPVSAVRSLITWTSTRPTANPQTGHQLAVEAECHPRHAALGARLMRPRRAAQPPAAPAGSARSTIGAVTHRGEDPPHDRGIAADSVQRGVIIRPPRRHARPASRSRFGGLAFHDPDDIERSHVRHDPPSPRPAQGREPLPPPRHPGPHVARPGASYRRWHREDLPPYWCRAGNADPDTRPGLCAQRYRAAPPHPPNR